MIKIFTCLLVANLGLTLRSRLKCQVRKMTDTGNDEVENEFLVSFHIIRINIKFENFISNCIRFLLKNNLRNDMKISILYIFEKSKFVTCIISKNIILRFNIF